MTEENPAPAAAVDPPPAPAAAAAAEPKKPFLARKGVLYGGGAIALVIALAAGFGLGYWTARPEHHGHRGKAWTVTYHGDGPGRAGMGEYRFPGPPARRGPERPRVQPLPAELRPAAFGTIGQVNGDDWILNGLDGKTVTVRITGQTTFGTAQFPQERPQFAAGDTVVVRGKAENNTITATNVVERQGPRPPR